jgi:hypothetical protein
MSPAGAKTPYRSAGAPMSPAGAKRPYRGAKTSRVRQPK